MEERLEADGTAALDRYERSADPGDLRAADQSLGRIIAEHPDHPGCGGWVARLSEAWTARAGESERTEDYDAALAWTNRLLSELPRPGEDRDEVLVRVADLLSDRSWTVREAADTPEQTTAELNRLVRQLTALAGREAGPVVRHYLRLMLGAALDDQARAGAGDLDEAVAALMPALDTLAGRPSAEVGRWVAADRLAAFAGTLAAVLIRRAGRDESLPDLDRAVAVLDRALRLHAEPAELRSDLSARLAFVHQQRWHARTLFGDRAGASADLDAGVAACDAALAGDNPWVHGLRGELLQARAEQNGSASDARAAAQALERAAREAADDPDAWWLWSSAATASRLVTGDLAGLAAAAGHLDRALTYAMPDDDRLRLHAERVTVGHLLINSQAPGGTGAGTLREAVDAGIRALGKAGQADLRRRSATALVLAYGSFAAAGSDLGEVDVGGIGALLRLAAEHPDNDAEWQAMVDYGLGTVEHYAAMLGPDRGSDAGLGRLARAAAFENPSADFAQRLRYVLSFAGQAVSGTTGSLTTGQAARKQAAADRPLPDRASDQPPVSPSDHQIVAANAELMERMQAGDTAGAAASARTWLAILEQADLSGMDLTFLQMLRAVAALGDPSGSTTMTIPRIEATSGMAAQVQLAGALVTASAVLAQAIAHDDLGRLRHTAAGLQHLITLAGPANWRLRVGALTLAAQAHLRIAQRSPGAEADAGRAAELFAAALESSGGVGFPMWSQLAMGRARALRLTGSRGWTESRALGLSALQGHAWQVFAQAGTDNSIAAARQAAADARTVAGWCLADHDRAPAALEQLVAALDAGRGLVLRATTTSRVIVDRLTRAGHPDVAREWQATAGLGHDLVSGLAMSTPAGPPAGAEIPDDLRLRVLRALGTTEVVGYEQISTAQIRTALVATGSHALVYLVAGEAGGDGAAVVVPADAPPRVIRLPRLHLGPSSPVRRFLDSPARSGQAPATPAVTNPEEGLEDLCGWAWDAAVRAVLATFPSRPARLVLVPMGMLGLVPWHAAFDRRQRHTRYAAQDCVISYTPSAHTLCTLAEHTPGGIESALVVGNPTGDLRFAGYEAQAIRAAFYPGGSYFGRPADEATAAGSPADVLDWITTRPPGPAALHFACHGAVDPRSPADAYLALAGKAELTVRTLLERSQTAALDVQEVFLAACTTSVGGDDHDEVLSLATSFLAAGARTAFGSLWPVPDTHTSLLMFKVHQHLRGDGLSPADALHRAQLWMLDTDRKTDDLPPRLRRHCRPGTIFPLASWAGFIHTGR